MADAQQMLQQVMRDYFTRYQQAWILDESQMKLAEKSRRIGWTYATSYRRVVKALRVPGLDCWVSTRDLSTAKEFVRDCLQWVRLANLVGQVTLGTEVINIEKNVSAQVIKFPNDSRIYVLTSNPDALAGKGGDIVLDEFALHKDQQLLWQVALPTASVWGYQIEVISTHRGKNTLFNRFVKDAKARNTMGWSFFSITIVQAAEQGLVDRINAATAKRGGKPLTPAEFVALQRKRCATEGQWNQEFMCQPQDDLGSLLTYDMIAGCSLPWEKLRTDPSVVLGSRFAGMDIARRRHKSVIWIVEEFGAIQWTRRVCVMEDTKLRHQRETFCAMYRAWGCSGGGIDATGIGLQLAEDAQDDLGVGESLQAVTFTAANQNEMANLMVKSFQDLTVRVPEDRAIEESLHKVEKAVTDKGNITYVAPDDEDGHADEFWALALALRSTRQGSGPVRGMALGNPIDRDGPPDPEARRHRPDHSYDYFPDRADSGGFASARGIKEAY